MTRDTADMPLGPSLPAAPVAPVAPVTPAGPAAPVAPAGPVAPLVPSSPEQPWKAMMAAALISPNDTHDFSVRISRFLFLDLRRRDLQRSTDAQVTEAPKFPSNYPLRGGARRAYND